VGGGGGGGGEGGQSEGEARSAAPRALAGTPPGLRPSIFVVLTPSPFVSDASAGSPRAAARRGSCYCESGGRHVPPFVRVEDKWRRCKEGKGSYCVGALRRHVRNAAAKRTNGGGGGAAAKAIAFECTRKTPFRFLLLGVPLHRRRHP